MSTSWHLATSPVPSFGDSNWIPSKPSGHRQDRRRIDGKRKIKVIVVDDETVIAETVVEILNQEGFEAIAASNGAGAIELAKTYNPDVVLSDVIMPGLNGIELGVRVRDIAPQCKIILLSGQAATVDLLEQAREQGHSFDILAKPIKPEQLISAIRAGFDFY